LDEDVCGFEGDVCGLESGVPVAVRAAGVRALVATWLARLLAPQPGALPQPPPDRAVLRRVLRAALREGGARGAELVRAVYGCDPGLIPRSRCGRSDVDGDARMVAELAALLGQLGPDEPEGPEGPGAVEVAGAVLGGEVEYGAAAERFAARIERTGHQACARSFPLRLADGDAADTSGRRRGWVRAGWWTECALGAVLGPAGLELPADADPPCVAPRVAQVQAVEAWDGRQAPPRGAAPPGTGARAGQPWGSTAGTRLSRAAAGAGSERQVGRQGWVEDGGDGWAGGLAGGWAGGWEEEGATEPGLAEALRRGDAVAISAAAAMVRVLV
jgi:hypothetical protein